jgi:sugar phosphate permease
VPPSNELTDRLPTTPALDPSNGTVLDNSLDKTLRYRWLIFAVLAGGYILVYFHRLAPAVVAVDMMRDLQAGGTLLGLLGSAYFYPYAMMQLPAGLLADSWGPRRTITMFSLIACTGSLILGLAPTATVAIIGRTLVGLGVAMLFVPTMKILTEWFRPNEFAGMTGILLALGGVGSLISTTPLALMTEQFGWRFAFLIVAGLTLILAILVWSLVRDRPGDFGWQPPVNITQQRQTVTDLIAGVRTVIGNRFFWPLAVWFFFHTAVFFSFGGLWGGPYLQQIYGLSRTDAGQVLSMLAIGLIIGGPLQSWLSIRVFNRHKPVLILSSLCTVLSAGLLAFATADLPLPGLYLICFFLGCFTAASVVIGFSVTKELFEARIAGTAIGLINLFPFAGGAIFQPLLGLVLEQSGRTGEAFTLHGYQHAFSILFICAALALLASLFIKETSTERH